MNRNRANRALSKRALLAGLAAAQFKRLTFEDPITMQRVGRSRGILLNKQMYNARSLARSMQHGYSFVPHSVRPLTLAEKQRIWTLVPRSRKHAPPVYSRYRRR